MATALRPLTDEDVDWCVDLLDDWDPSLTRDYSRRLLTGLAAPILHADVAWVDGERAGLGLVITPTGLPYPLLHVVVAPAHRGTGVGSSLYAVAARSLPPGPIGSGMRDDDPESLAIAQHWGFEVLGHGIESVLPLADRPAGPDLPPDVRLERVTAQQVAGSGFDVDGFLAQVGDYPEVEIYGSSMSNEVLLANVPESVWLLLMDDEGIAAATAVHPRPGGEWYIGFTAVLPRARGRGLARVAKEQAHRWAQAEGATAMRTTNEERNTRIRGLNESLGYRKVSGDLRLVRWASTG